MCIAESVSGVKYFRASPDWLVAMAIVYPALVRVAMALILPGSAFHSSGDFI